MESSVMARTLATLWAVTHVLQYGFAITGLNGISEAVTCADRPDGFTGPKSGWITPCVPMHSTQFGLVVSIFTIGGLFGSLSTDFIARKTGRIGTFRIAALVIVAGSALVGLAKSVIPMLIGRVFIGIGCGIATVSVPVFLAEVAPPNIKQAIGIGNQLFIVIGMLTGQALALPLAKETTWRWVFAVSFFLGIAQILGSFFVRSPRESHERNQDDEEAPLLPDGGGQADKKSMSIRELFTSHDPVIRQGLIVVIVTQVCQQIVGISPVMYFSTRILKPVFSANSRLVALLIVAWKIPLTVLPAFIIDRMGSRPILLFSSGVMVFFALLLVYGLNTDSGPASAVAIVSFVSAYSVGLGPVVWVVLAEVMPPQARTAAGAIGIALNWTINFFLGSAFLPLQQWLSGGKDSGEGNVFYVFAVTCALAFIAMRQSYAAYDKVKA